MSVENKDFFIIKFSEFDRSFPLHSNPLEVIIDQMLRDKGKSPVSQDQNIKKTYTDPTTGLELPRRLDDPAYGV